MAKISNSLAEAIAVEEKESRKNCTLGKVIDALSKDDQQALQEAIRSGVSATVIMRAFKRLETTVSYYTVRRHIAGDCPCFDA